MPPMEQMSHALRTLQTAQSELIAAQLGVENSVKACREMLSDAFVAQNVCEVGAEELSQLDVTNEARATTRSDLDQALCQANEIDAQKNLMKKDLTRHELIHTKNRNDNKHAHASLSFLRSEKPNPTVTGLDLAQVQQAIVQVELFDKKTRESHEKVRDILNVIDFQQKTLGQMMYNIQTLMLKESRLLEKANGIENKLQEARADFQTLLFCADAMF